MKAGKISGYLGPSAFPPKTLHLANGAVTCFDFLNGLELPNIWLASLDVCFLDLSSKIILKPFSLATEYYMIVKYLMKCLD